MKNLEIRTNNWEYRAFAVYGRQEQKNGRYRFSDVPPFRPCKVFVLHFQPFYDIGCVAWLCRLIHLVCHFFRSINKNGEMMWKCVTYSTFFSRCAEQNAKKEHDVGDIWWTSNKISLLKPNATFIISDRSTMGNKWYKNIWDLSTNQSCDYSLGDFWKYYQSRDLS